VVLGTVDRSFGTLVVWNAIKTAIIKQHVAGYGGAKNGENGFAENPMNWL
jgi:hypothetical protein